MLIGLPVNARPLVVGVEPSVVTYVAASGAVEIETCKGPGMEPLWALKIGGAGD